MLDKSNKTWQEFGNSPCARMCNKHFPQIWVEHPTNAHDMLMDSYCTKTCKKNVLTKCWTKVTKPGRNLAIHRVQECATNIFHKFGWNIRPLPMTCSWTHIVQKPARKMFCQNAGQNSQNLAEIGQFTVS